jgi:hypothetical protein
MGVMGDRSGILQEGSWCRESERGALGVLKKVRPSAARRGLRGLAGECGECVEA